MQSNSISVKNVTFVTNIFPIRRIYDVKCYLAAYLCTDSRLMNCDNCDKPFFAHEK